MSDPALQKTPPSYHDLHITTAHIPRTKLFNMPFRFFVQCTRVGGWELWQTPDRVENATLVAGEYEGGDKWLVLDVAGHIIVDGRKVEGTVDAE